MKKLFITAIPLALSFALIAGGPGNNEPSGPGINLGQSINPWANLYVLTVNGSNAVLKGTITATNGLYYVPQNNGTNPANSLQPAFAWGALMGYTTNLINGGANTYQAITNFTIARTNQFGANLATGTLTNLIAGFYRIGIHLSAVSVDAGAVIEGELFLNGIQRDEVSFLSTFDPGTPRLKGVSAMGILYITNNTPITFQVKSSGAGGVNVYRSQMVIGTP